MTIPELTAAAATLRQIEATVLALRGSFLMSGEVSLGRQALDIGILIADLVSAIEGEITKRRTP